MRKHAAIHTSSVLLALASVSFAADAAAPTTAPAAGTYEAYQVAARAALADYTKLIPKPEGLADAHAAERDAVAPQAIPLMKQVLSNLDEMIDARPNLVKQITAVRLNQEAILYALGDSDTVKSLDEKAAGTGPSSTSALNVVLRGKWLRAGQDVAKQTDVSAEIDKAAAAHPTDLYLTQFITDIRPHVKDPALKQHLMDVMANTMTGPMAKMQVAAMKASDTLQAVEGKPLVLAGKTPEGKDFTTADWKGKVILVDFWAVWCAPCVAELPRVKAVYEQYHDKGFEVLGVDNDEQAETVIKFAAKRGLPWPQLFDADAGEKGLWHPLTKSFGINGIPVMFLIDKKGVVRTVEAREDFETLIPKMLAE